MIRGYLSMCCGCIAIETPERRMGQVGGVHPVWECVCGVCVGVGVCGCGCVCVGGWVGVCGCVCVCSSVCHSCSCPHWS